MKLASYKDGSRDGQLLVVSRDLSLAHYATGIATRLQQVLDDWNFLAPQLQALSQTLDHGKARHAFPFDPRRCMAPLPRAFLFARADAHTPSGFSIERGDHLLGPCDPVPPALAARMLSLQGQVAAITGDIPAGAEALAALEGVRLLVLAARIEAQAADGSCISNTPWACGPVALTPDELEGAWLGGHAMLSLRLLRQGAKAAPALPAEARPLGELLAALAAQQGLRAGSVVGTSLMAATADTPHRALGDRLQFEALDAAGHSPFGAISPAVFAPEPADPLPQDPPAVPADIATNGPAA